MTRPVDTKGFCSDEFAGFKDDFERNFAEDLELGASLCLTLDGETIVDIHGGYADLAKTRPWDEDTVACVFSATKIPVSICALMLIDRGLLALDEPIARYWPEFAQHGKGDITIRQAMTHRARVPGLTKPLPPSAIGDWDRVVEAIAAEKPWFEEDRVCYHAFTYGFILGELIQRVAGKPFHRFFDEELIQPLQADFQMAFSDEAELARVAEYVRGKPLPHEPGSIQARVFESFTEPLENDAWYTWETVSRVNPAGGGHSNARGLCTIATMMANGGESAGRRYLSPELVRDASSQQYHGEDPMLGDIRLGLGFGLDSPHFAAPTPQAYHWGGYGGAWCFMDSTRRLAGAYVMNKMIVAEEWGEFVDPRMVRFFTRVRSTFC